MQPPPWQRGGGAGAKGIHAHTVPHQCHHPHRLTLTLPVTATVTDSTVSPESGLLRCRLCAGVGAAAAPYLPPPLPSRAPAARSRAQRPSHKPKGARRKPNKCLGSRRKPSAREMQVGGAGQKAASPGAGGGAPASLATAQPTAASRNKALVPQPHSGNANAAGGVVSEMGRVLLSCTMLGSSASVDATRRHFERLEVTKSVAAAAPPPATAPAPRQPGAGLDAVPVPLGDGSEATRLAASAAAASRRHRKKKGRKARSHADGSATTPLPTSLSAASQSVPTPTPSEPSKPPASNFVESPAFASAESLRTAIREETQRLLELAGDDVLVLQMAAGRIKLHVQKLEAMRASKFGRQSGQGMSTSRLVDGKLSVGAQATSSRRWLTPHESGYESDSSFTSASTSLTDAVPLASYVNPAQAGLRLLRGSAQIKLLSATQDALSRCSTLCQALADPEAPGAAERRELLQRALRTLADVANEATSQ